RDPSRMALVQVNFRVQKTTAASLQLPGIKAEPLIELIDTGAWKFDLALYLAPDGSGDSFFEYNSDLFDAATIQRIVGEFERLLAEFVRKPEPPLMSLEVMSQLGRRTPAMEKISDKPKMKSLKDF